MLIEYYYTLIMHLVHDGRYVNMIVKLHATVYICIANKYPRYRLPYIVLISYVSKFN